jgi:hypothetical protein
MAILPKGVSAADFSAAMTKFETAIGKQWVFTLRVGLMNCITGSHTKSLTLPLAKLLPLGFVLRGEPAGVYPKLDRSDSPGYRVTNYS